MITHFKMLALCFVLLFMGCKKSSSFPDQAKSYLRISDVTQQRDSLNSTLRFRITLTPVINKQVKVDFATEDATAKATVDYIAKSGTITFEPNQSEAFVDISIIGRQLRQSEQQLYLKLSNAVGAQLENDRATATLQNVGKYTLVWSDEFNAALLNTSDWNYETGGGGWGNNELQNYTSGTNNAYIENGNLVIEAKQEISGSRAYSSARLTTKGKRKFTYGRFEIRAKVPATKGLWPALWMLGENIDQVSWPACGEIDIMEMINKETPSKVYGTGHWGINSAAHLSSGGNYSLSSGFFADDYHVFSLEWNADKIQWLVDGTKFHEVSKQQVTGGNYPFNKDFFFIMNVAVGGNWPGSPDATSVFPQKMYVDYIRVYQK